VGALGEMETLGAADEAREGAHLRRRYQRRRLAHLALAVEEHVRCQSEYESWQRIPRLSEGFLETDRAIRASSLQSVATARLAARACGRQLRAEGVEPSRLVTLVKQVVERALNQTKIEYPSVLRMRILAWAIEGYNAGD